VNCTYQTCTRTLLWFWAHTVCLPTERRLLKTYTHSASSSQYRDQVCVQAAFGVAHRACYLQAQTRIRPCMSGMAPTRLFQAIRLPAVPIKALVDPKAHDERRGVCARYARSATDAAHLLACLRSNAILRFSSGLDGQAQRNMTSYGE